MGERSNQSEVARLREQIVAEYLAAKQGMEGLACGTTQHTFITKRMEHMGVLQEELQQLVGEQAIGLVAEALVSL